MKAVALLALCVALARSEDGNYLYQGRPYGTQAALNPFYILVNGAYDMLQTRSMTNRVARLDYGTGFANVNRNLLSPLESIGKYGWGDFISTEVVPTRLKIEHSQWVPNYTLHTIGGGLTYRSLAEWYGYHGARYPRLLAATNCFLYGYVNEAVENGELRGVNVDAIADLLIFNPLGVLLFSQDPIARFFGEELHAANWSSLPLMNLRTGQLDNTALSFSFKYFPWEKPLGLFYYTGMNSVLGLTWRAREHSLSAGGGVGTVGVVETDQSNGERKSTVVLGKTLGLFWDKNNSLLASLVLSNQRLYSVRLNLYPLPSMEKWPVKPGLFLARGYYGEFYLGLAMNVAPAGLSYFLD